MNLLRSRLENIDGVIKEKLKWENKFKNEAEKNKSLSQSNSNLKKEVNQMKVLLERADKTEWAMEELK